MQVISVNNLQSLGHLKLTPSMQEDMDSAQLVTTVLQELLIPFLVPLAPSPHLLSFKRRGVALNAQQGNTVLQQV